MKETIKNLVERRSVRSYSSKQITKEELYAILEAGRAGRKRGCVRKVRGLSFNLYF
ncbi:nitroreductase family protein [Lacrimispora indolis]|uniref:nitroreductase family protein n=1 Tax=Lacrimispora indolis TaxID=69825 RepID=UPI0004154CFE|nr:nitroreductase family protein [[Clostridium] methoxybenzovorans]